MRIIEQKGEHSFAFSRYLEPIARVRLGEEVVLQTEDCFKGLVKTENDFPEVVLKNSGYLNPQTGPLYIEGAQPGDTLKVYILNIEPSRDWAVSCIQKPLGGLTPNKFTRMLNQPIAEKTWIYRFDKNGSLRHDDFLCFPWKPFLGTIATASDLEVISALTPYENGGNMDTPDAKPGNIVYLPVSVEGAYFFTGDCHANQGEGELCGVALEISAKVTLRFELIKRKRIKWPRIESPDEYMVVGSARPMEDAARIAYAELIDWMTEFGWDSLDAYQALTQAGRLYCANMVDTNYSMVAKVDKHLAMRQK
jgi:acetamidase/formamidase